METAPATARRNPGFPITSKGLLYAGTLLFTLLVGYIDFITGPQPTMGPFYLLPIGVAAWFLNPGWAYSLALFSLVMRLVVPSPLIDFHHLPYTSAWNMMNRAALNLGLALVLARLSRLSRHLEGLVQQRTRALASEVAERQRAESALHRLAAQLAEAEESQRGRIAQEIHDAIGQMLSLVKLNVEMALADALIIRDSINGFLKRPKCFRN